MTEQHKPLRMNAYYYGFRSTGVELVDRVLSAVAHAGKGYHHTEGWTEPVPDYEPFRGGDYVEWIQNAAVDTAQALRSIEAERDTLKAALQAAEQFIHVGVSRGPAVNGWQNTVDLVTAALAACVPPQETDR